MKLATLAERLQAERHRRFVGRGREIEAFERAFADGTRSLLFVTGEAGIGKSSLLLELERRCRVSGVRAAHLDAAELARAQAPALARLRRRALTDLGAYQEARGDRRSVLFVDSFEGAATSEHWLLGELLPTLPEDVLVVLASRRAPPNSLSLDAAWARLMLRIDMEPLSEADSARLLEVRDVPGHARDSIVEGAGGYPLLLVLAGELASRSPSGSFSRSGWRELQRVLREQFFCAPLARGQRLALDACALARTTTMELLEHVLTRLEEPEMQARELYEWLAQLPFVEEARPGLRLQVLPRLALLSRMHHENLERQRLVAKAVREFCVDVLAVSDTPESSFADLFYIDRGLPLMRQLTSPLPDTAGDQFEPALEEDHSALIEIIRAHEGPTGARLASLRLAGEPTCFEVVHGEGVRAVLHRARLSATSRLTDEFLDEDPCTPLVRAFLQANPLRDEEQCLFFRWFLDAEDHQAFSPRVFAISARQAQLVLSTPHLAYSLCVYRDPQKWLEIFRATNIPYHVCGRFVVDGRDYTLLAFSWRERSYRDVLVDAWAATAERSPSSTPPMEDESRAKVRLRAAELGRKKHLTARELQVLELICLGTSVSEISTRLQIRPRTIKFHQENLLRKMGANSRLELLRLLL